MLDKSSEAERNLLGGLFSLPTDVDEVRGIVAPEDFTREENGAIFRALCALTDAGKPIDKATVAAELSRQAIRGVTQDHLDMAWVAIGPVAGAAYYAQTVRETSIRRKGAQLCEAARTRLLSGEGEATEILDAHEASLFALTSGLATEFADAATVVRESTKALQARYEQGGEIVGLPSGLRDVDKITAGFQPGDLVIIAARPSMGKTALLLNIAQHCVLRLKRPVALCSLEMPRRQLADRIICSEARIPSGDFRRAQFLSTEWDRIAVAAEALAGSQIRIDDTPALSLAQIRAKVRPLAARLAAAGTPLALLGIDYLQLMAHPQAKGETRDAAIGATTRGLKALAKQLGIPILVLSQLNREVEKRADKRPTMADLRESGSIEADADTILFLYRDEVYAPSDADGLDHREQERRLAVKGIAEVIVAKQRNGAIGNVRVQYDGPTMTFRDLSRGESSPHWSDQ